MKGWVNLNLNEIKFACNSKYSKINFRRMSFYEQIQFILLINIKSIENTNDVGDILTKVNTNDIETTLYEEILLYGYRSEYIEDSNIYMGGKLNYSERND